MAHLRKLLPPPNQAQERPTKDHWVEIESLGGTLPSDYHQFVEVYGSGCIDEFIWIFNPVANNKNINFSCQAEKQLDALREVNAFGLEASMILFPEPSGLLPIGITDNGDVIVWQTKETPEDWIVGVLPSRNSPVLLFERNLTGFISGLLERAIVCQVFPHDFPSDEPRFKSII
jgi:hypothetical protein